MKIIITGAAGLVGQNLIIALKEHTQHTLVALDKHPHNSAILRHLHPDIEVIEADLAERGTWERHFEGGDLLIMLQAQIGAAKPELFERNTLQSTRNVLQAMRDHGITQLIHISSSVVMSKADDWYTQSKKRQEELILHSDLHYTILRPTLMFGWFDRKHLGWLSRFMQRVPFFPIPGHGRYVRQPLYERDFCAIILSCIERPKVGEIFNITGREEITYLDIIRTIKQTNRARTPIVRIPYGLFYALLWFYGRFSDEPPFTTQQLQALVADDHFELIPWWEIFGVEATPFARAMEETLTDACYASYVLEF